MAALPDNDRIAGPFIAAAGQTDVPADFPLFRIDGLRLQIERDGVFLPLERHPAVDAVDQTASGFTARRTTPFNAGDRIWVFSDLPPERDRQHTPNGAIRSVTLEDDAVSAQAQLQEARRDRDHALRLPLGSQGGVVPWSPTLGERFVTIDSAGRPQVVVRPDDFDALFKANRTGDNLTPEDTAEFNDRLEQYRQPYAKPLMDFVKDVDAADWKPYFDAAVDWAAEHAPHGCNIVLPRQTPRGGIPLSFVKPILSDGVYFTGAHRRGWASNWTAALDQCDINLLPSGANPAFKWGDNSYDPAKPGGFVQSGGGLMHLNIRGWEATDALAVTRGIVGPKFKGLFVWSPHGGIRVENGSDADVEFVWLEGFRDFGIDLVGTGEGMVDGRAAGPGRGQNHSLRECVLVGSGDELNPTSTGRAFAIRGACHTVMGKNIQVVKGGGDVAIYIGDRKNNTEVQRPHFISLHDAQVDYVKLRCIDVADAQDVWFSGSVYLNGSAGEAIRVGPDARNVNMQWPRGYGSQSRMVTIAGKQVNFLGGSFRHWDDDGASSEPCIYIEATADAVSLTDITFGDPTLSPAPHTGKLAVYAPAEATGSLSIVGCGFYGLAANLIDVGGMTLNTAGCVTQSGAAALPVHGSNIDAMLKASSPVYDSRAAIPALPIAISRVGFRVRNRTYFLSRRADGPITLGDGSRWEPDGVPTPQHFGAMGDRLTFDNDALQAAVNWAGTINTYPDPNFPATTAAVFVPAGIYTIPAGQTITLPRGVNLIGEGQAATLFLHFGGGVPAFATDAGQASNTNIKLRDFTLRSVSTPLGGTTYGVYFHGGYKNCELSNVTLRGCKVNLGGDRCWTLLVSHCNLDGATEYNVRFGNLTCATFFENRIDAGGICNVLISGADSSPNNTNHVKFIGGSYQTAQEASIRLVDVPDATFIAVYFEGNNKSGGGFADIEWLAGGLNLGRALSIVDGIWSASGGGANSRMVKASAPGRVTLIGAKSYVGTAPARYVVGVDLASAVISADIVGGQIDADARVVTAGASTVVRDSGAFYMRAGIFADDAAAAAGGVAVTQPYRKASGVLAWRVA